MRRAPRALVYALHSGCLHGTERMALATLSALRDRFRPVWLAPPGEATDEARRRGFVVHEVRGRAATARALRAALLAFDQVVLLATTTTQSLLFEGLRRLHPAIETAHLHVVHGGAEERRAYGNKWLVQRLGVRLVAVSDFVRERLVEHGCRPAAIDVIGNFVEPQRLRMLGSMAPRRRPLRHVAMISRLDPIKRVDRLLDALDVAPDLADVTFDVYGRGADFDRIAARARRDHPNVVLHGFRADAAQRLAEADALLHTCDREPYGLAIDEAMLAGLPVIAPDRGGASVLVENARTGITVDVDDPVTIATALRELRDRTIEDRAALGVRSRQAAILRSTLGLGAQRWRRVIQDAIQRRRQRGITVGSPRNGDRQVVHVDGIPIDALGFDATVERLGHWLGGQGPRRVATANADFLCRSQDDHELAEALRTADMVTADGFPLVLAARLAGERIPERVAGSDLLEPLVAAAASRGRSVYLLGGMPGVAAEAARRFCGRHAGLRIVGCDERRVDLAAEDGCDRLTADIRASGADLLVVALGCPKQELFLARHLAATGARLGIGVGASLDFLVGASRRAPRLFQRLRLEWLFRALSEPRRLGPRYARNLPYVLGLWLRAIRARRSGARPATPFDPART